MLLRKNTLIMVMLIQIVPSVLIIEDARIVILIVNLYFQHYVHDAHILKIYYVHNVNVHHVHNVLLYNCKED